LQPGAATPASAAAFVGPAGGSLRRGGVLAAIEGQVTGIARTGIVIIALGILGTTARRLDKDTLAPLARDGLAGRLGAIGHGLARARGRRLDGDARDEATHGKGGQGFQGTAAVAETTQAAGERIEANIVQGDSFAGREARRRAIPHRDECRVPAEALQPRATGARRSLHCVWSSTIVAAVTCHAFTRCRVEHLPQHELLRAAA
jgi:hypothetical protein